MDPLKKWDEAVRIAKSMKTTSNKFHILKGSELKNAQKIYCASTNFFSQ